MGVYGSLHGYRGICRGIRGILWECVNRVHLNIGIAYHVRAYTTTTSYDDTYTVKCSGMVRLITLHIISDI